MDNSEVVKRAYTNALQSIVHNLDAIFSLQAKLDIANERIAELEKEVAKTKCDEQPQL